MTDESIMLFLFGCGIIVGIVFWELFSIFQRYWNGRMEYQQEIWEARVEYERNKDMYQREEGKE